jgi:ABC-type lipopolysaccharide export system ATPase subunit
MLNEEKEKLRKTSPLTIIDYIRNSIDILIDLKVEEKLEAIKKLNLSDEEEEEKQNEYEVLLRKLESDIRIHIKV